MTWFEAALDRLNAFDAERAQRYPGDAGTRQPVHTCYIPARDVTADLPQRWGATALALAPQCELPQVSSQVLEKLRREPVEDLRVDFEDGYGAPPDAEEDEDARRAAQAALTWELHSFGLRVKSFDTPRLRARSVRTLEIFLAELGARVPVITFPKVTDVAQVEVFVAILELLEQRLGLDAGSLRFEIQVETPQSIIGPDGRLALPAWIAAGHGRVSGLHFGTYDYTAGIGLGAAEQHLAHRSCDFARHVMQVAAAGTGVRLSDGSSNLLPVGEAAQHAWRTHYTLVRRSLSHGFYQGWDLHPGQLVSRYAAVFAHFREGAPADAARLRAYVERAGGAIADEPATAQALSQSFLQAVDCGALTSDEVSELTGLPVEALRSLAQRNAS